MVTVISAKVKLPEKLLETFIVETALPSVELVVSKNPNGAELLRIDSAILKNFSSTTLTNDSPTSSSVLPAVPRPQSD